MAGRGSSSHLAPYSLSCARAGVACTRAGVASARAGVACARDGVAYAREGVACTRAGVTCNLRPDLGNIFLVQKIFYKDFKNILTKIYTYG